MIGVTPPSVADWLSEKDLFSLWPCWIFVTVHGAFSSSGERGLLLVVVRGLLPAAAFLVQLPGLELCLWLCAQT